MRKIILQKKKKKKKKKKFKENNAKFRVHCTTYIYGIRSRNSSMKVKNLYVTNVLKLKCYNTNFLFLNKPKIDLSIFYISFFFQKHDKCAKYF